MSGDLPFEPRRLAATDADWHRRSAGSPRDPQFTIQGVHLKEVLGVLRRYAWLVIAVTIAVLAVTAWYTTAQPQSYQAGALIRLADTRRAIAGEIEKETRDRPIGRFTDEVLTQIQVLKGRTVIGEVVDREGLRLASTAAEFPVRLLHDVQVAPATDIEAIDLHFLERGVRIRTVRGEDHVAYGTPVDLGGVRFRLPANRAAIAGVDSAQLVVLSREAAVNHVLAGLTAVQRASTDAIDVTLASSDSILAKRVVNAIAHVFQDYDARLAQQQSQRRRIFLEEQLQAMDSLHFAAQEELSGFRGRAQVFHSRDRITAQQQALLNLDIRREELAASRQMYQSLLATIAQAAPGERQGALRTLISSPELAANPVIEQLYSQLARYEAERAQLLAGPLRSTEESPDVRRLNALIAEVELKLADAARSHVRLQDAQIGALDDLRRRSTAEVQRLPSMEAEEARLMQHVASLGRVVDHLRTELQQARMAEAVETGRVEIVHLASEAVPVRARTGTKLIVAAMLGLLLGGSSAFAAEAINTSIRRPRDLAAALHVPRLATIPRIQGANHRRLLRLPGIVGGRPRQNGARKASLSVEPNSLVADAYRSLRTNLAFATGTTALRSLVVTSASPRDGKTTTAANLAVSFARHGTRVLLVDADLRAPRVHEVFGIEQTPGLSAVLEGRCKPLEAIKPTALPGLHVLPSGDRPVDPTELLEGPQMRAFLAGCREHFDLIVIDTPPVLVAPETAILAAEVDAVLPVVRAGQTERAAAEEAMHQLAFAGARVPGAVLNDADALLPRYGVYYGAYGYYPQRAAR